MKVDNTNDSQQYMSKTLLRINQCDMEQRMTIKIASGVGRASCILTQSFTRLLSHEKGSGSTETGISWQIHKLTMVI